MSNLWRIWDKSLGEKLGWWLSEHSGGLPTSLRVL